MLKKHWFKIAAAVLLAIALAIYIPYTNWQNGLRQVFLGSFFSRLVAATRHLEVAIENPSPAALIAANEELKMLDVIMADYAAYVDRSLYIRPIPSFTDVANTLTYGRSSYPGFLREGILCDGEISPREIAYLETLNNDLKEKLVEKMASPEDRFQVDLTIRIHEFNDVVRQFFEK